MSGLQSYLAGTAAEEAVARQYCAGGHRLRETRWRGGLGEVDLVFETDAGFVFVEVKAARSHDAALRRVSSRQIARIGVSAERYADRWTGTAPPELRIDVALVDGSGTISILENATMH